MKASLRRIRISPQKVNLVAALVRGKKVGEALTLLKFTPKRSAPILAKLIASAAANAENNFKQDPENLVISRLIVNEGMTLKRGRPISRGRWHPILKRTAKILIELTPAVAEKPTKKAEKKAVPKVEKKAEEEKKAEPKEIKKVVEKAEKVVPKIKKTEEAEPKTEKAEAKVPKTEKAEKVEAPAVAFKKSSIKKDS